LVAKEDSRFVSPASMSTFFGTPDIRTTSIGSNAAAIRRKTGSGQKKVYCTSTQLSNVADCESKARKGSRYCSKSQAHYAGSLFFCSPERSGHFNSMFPTTGKSPTQSVFVPSILYPIPGIGEMLSCDKKDA
jgi:hypothetical protein